MNTVKWGNFARGCNFALCNGKLQGTPPLKMRNVRGTNVNQLSHSLPELRHSLLYLKSLLLKHKHPTKSSHPYFFLGADWCA